jgi:phosphate transport system substrate-binding protein
MFKKMVMKKNTINDEAKISLDNDTMIKEINLHSNSIGYISSTYAKDVKILSIQSDNVRSYKPTTASIQTEEYPLSRRLYLYSPERSLNKYLNSFLEFSLSTPGQKVVQSSGFIPQIIRLIKPEIEGSFSQQYIDIIQNAMRINMNFRFNKAGSEIDNRSVKDLNRLSQFIKKEKLSFCKFRLIGFSDDSQGIRERVIANH